MANVYRLTLCVFSLSLMVAIVVIVFGFLFMIRTKKVDPVVYPPKCATVALITIGCISLLSGAAGILGVTWKKSYLLIVVALVMVLFLTIETVSIALVYQYYVQINPSLFDSMKGYITDYHNYKDQNQTDPIEDVQRKMSCCGAFAANDWGQVMKGYPLSCCNEGRETCPQPDYKVSCVERFKQTIITCNIVLIYMAIVSAVLHSLSLILCCHLRKRANDDKYREYQPIAQ